MPPTRSTKKLFDSRELRKSRRPPPEFFFFQAEDGIRDADVTGVQRVLFRSAARLRSSSAFRALAARRACHHALHSFEKQPAFLPIAPNALPRTPPKREHAPFF